MSRDDDRRAEREARRTADLPSAASEPVAETRTRTGLAQFLREVRSELRKVAWPNRKELISYTIVVLVMSLVLTLLIWGFDFIVRDAIINTLG
ncbi:preprotein translocase subunit SecE [Nitriliruptor alkaliphilus]|uniref:preprotein translocase subunit SecE n=1 Tax=Nitriliruptor alkaliphilus TaxID=427918 RepID=UPI0009FB07C4|nr:preprotein translocase subunit SecE [Nitriliruptor alkaliphilus]